MSDICMLRAGLCSTFNGQPEYDVLVGGKNRNHQNLRQLDFVEKHQVEDDQK